MKRFLLSLLSFIPFLMVGCYEDSTGPEVPVIGGITLSQEQMTVGAEGGEFSVDIYAEYTFRAISSVDWIEISYGSCGTEYCTQYFNVKANDTTSSREGVITILCDDYNLLATLTIVQEAGSEQGSGSSIPNNEIWYTSSDGEIVTPYATDVFGANIVSNTYKNGKGVITFDDDVTSIGEGAFAYCSSLTSITIPDSVTSIGDYAFYYCSSLTSVTIPDSVASIGDYAFFYCTSLTSVTIPDSVTSIGEDAFYCCSSLTSVTIPNSITSIGSCAFAGCSSLTSVTIPDSVTSIGEGAFHGCSSLTSVTIPDSVTSIGYAVFAYCSSLTSVTIPNSVTSIGNAAFEGCSSLTSVYCKPTTPPTGGSDMFYNNAFGRKIYVPRNSVEAYKAAEYWSGYASYIVGYDF